MHPVPTTKYHIVMKAIFAACEHLGNESVWLIKVCRTSLFRIGMVAGFILASSLIYKADAQTPPPAAPTKKSEVRDLSKPPMRTLSARISMLNPSWDEPQQRALGPAVEIFFGGPAAPLDRVGKALPVGSIQMTPDVAGEWKWEQANRLLFFPTAAIGHDGGLLTAGHFGGGAAPFFGDERNGHRNFPGGKPGPSGAGAKESAAILSSFALDEAGRQGGPDPVQFPSRTHSEIRGKSDQGNP